MGVKNMVNIGDIIEGEIIDFTHEGNGVLKVDNYTVFVTGGIIGDKVTVRIVEIKKNFSIGSIINIIEPSTDRVLLDFELTESKGGIPFIEYEYEKQLEWKRDKVKKDIIKIAGITDFKINNTIGMDYPYGYRNHVQIPVGEKKGKSILGFFEISSNDIVDMESTILLPKVGNKILKLIRNWIEKHKIKPYDKKKKTGIIRHIGIRVNKDNEVMVIVVTGNNNLPFKEELIEILKNNNVISIYQNINILKSSITYGKDYIKIYGDYKLVDYIGEYKFYLSPKSFFQVNRIQVEVLYNKAIEYLNINENDIIYDLYCGIGTISLFIAPYAKNVYGIEIVKEAIEDAKENAKFNNILNAEFIPGKAEEILPRLMKKGTLGNKVVLDPPRRGCEKEVLEAIITMSPERIVYVSCNSTTMARDVKYLVENGYKVVEVQPVDMFPHTAHVECVVLMSRVKE